MISNLEVKVLYVLIRHVAGNSYSDLACGGEEFSKITLSILYFCILHLNVRRSCLGTVSANIDFLTNIWFKFAYIDQNRKQNI